jgi:hypothetical protein
MTADGSSASGNRINFWSEIRIACQPDYLSGAAEVLDRSIGAACVRRAGSASAHHEAK